MKDIPLFTTGSGVASLTLKEIPYNKRAYIRVQESLMPRQLLKECVDFCKIVGAEEIYATGCMELEEYPLHCRIVKMVCARESLDDTNVAVFPVTEATLEQFRTIYNEKMKDVPNAAFMASSDAADLLLKGNGYFVHNGEVVLGIGIADGNEIRAIAAVLPGAGRDVLLALNHVLTDEYVYVEVAESNHAAMKLYQRLGFICASEISRWYKIL